MSSTSPGAVFPPNEKRDGKDDKGQCPTEYTAGECENRRIFLAVEKWTQNRKCVAIRTLGSATAFGECNVDEFLVQ